jgi:AcrR family transcriptional regulator
MPTKAEQTERTRAALVAAARDLFATHGYAATSTEEIVRAAGVTRGALYHHFRDKLDLFEAVYEALEEELTAAIMRAAAAITDPIDLLRKGIAVFLDRCLDPAIQRIVLLEGPSVLGWERWHQIEMRHGLGLVQGTIQAAIDAGAIPGAPVEPLSHVLLGGLIEASMLLAASSDQRKARREIGRALNVLVDGLAASA